jgi:hypothetical protein
MADVIAAVDSTTGRFGPLVENALVALMQAAVLEGVTDTIANIDDVEQAVANKIATTITPAALKNLNVLPSAAKNLITGWFHCDGFGAIGDGVTDSRGGIQGALTAAGAAYIATGAVQQVYLPAGIFAVSSTAFYNDNGSQFGITSLLLPSGVDFFGPGTIKVKDANYGPGAVYGCIRSSSSGISKAKIRQITIDGNKGAQVASQQCSNILLTVVDDVEIDHVRSKRANGNGILIQGTSAVPATNVRITDCFVSEATMIGIQVSQFAALTIVRNVVGDCTNNGIDVYGENGSAQTNGEGFVIEANTVYNCSVGIFPETVSWGIVQGNLCMNNTESGIHVNRVNGVLRAVSLIANQCLGGPIGIFVTGDMFPGGIRIRDNVIDAVTQAGIQLGGGGASVSYVYIVNNSIDMATINTGALIAVAAGTPVWSQSMIRRTTTKNTDRSRDVYNLATSTVNTVSYDQANG